MLCTLAVRTTQQLYQKFFESYINQEEILIHESNCQQLCHTTVDFCSSQEQTFNVPPFSKIALSHIC